MFKDTGRYPNIAYLLPDKRPIICNISGDAQYFTTSPIGQDRGIELTIETPERIELEKNLRVEVRGIVYSVVQVIGVIPDKITQGFSQEARGAYYILSLK